VWLTVLGGHTLLLSMPSDSHKRLTMSLYRGTVSEVTKAVQVVASAIQMDRNLTHLDLQVNKGFTDEAGVALAEALVDFLDYQHQSTHDPFDSSRAQ
jgi:hypothetical protein